MKKRAAFLMIPALAMFMVPALASANWYYWWGIQGTWEMSASGSCLHSSMQYVLNTSPISPTNPDPKNWWTAQDGSDVYAGVAVANGTWTFERTGWNTGKGTYSQRIYATILPGGAKSMNGISIPPAVRVMPPLSVSPTPVEFYYEIAPSGDITITETLPSGGVTITHTGSISMDKMVMTLLTANNVQALPGMFGYTICNFARTLIKVNGVHE